MSGIEELRQRVSDAEERFGLFNEQHVKAGGRLIDLMNAVEVRICDQQGEIESQKAKIDGHDAAIAQQAEEIEKFKASAADKAEENEQLRAMLHALLDASEAGSRDVLAEAMMQLDSKVSVLMGDGAPEAVGEAEEPAVEEPAEIAAEIEEPAAEEPAPEEPAETAAETEEPVAEEPIAEAPAEIAAEAEEPIAEEPAEVEEPVAEEPVEIVAEVEEPAAEEPAEIADEESVAEEPAAEEPAGETGTPGSLDEIMERLSKLVQETDAAIAVPEPAAAESDDAAPADMPAETPEEAAEEAAEEPAQQASAAGS